MFATGVTDKTAATGRSQGYKHQSAYINAKPAHSEAEGVHVRLQQMVHRDDTDTESARASDMKLDASMSGSEAWVAHEIFHYEGSDVLLIPSHYLYTISLWDRMD